MTYATAPGETDRRQRLIVPANLLLTTSTGPLRAGSIEQGMIVRSDDERWCTVLAVGPAITSEAGVPVTTLRASALDDGVPSVDVTIWSDSRLRIGGLDVRARRLVNMATVVSDVLRNDQILALDLAADTPFALSGITLALVDPEGDEGVASNAELCEIRQRILERAIALGWQYVEDRRIQIAVDGSIVAPVAHDGSRWRVALRYPSLAFSIYSASAVVAQHHPSILDERRLGVQVISVRADGEEIALSSDAFAAGFYDVEHAPTHDFRWTDGAATLRLPRKASVVDIDIGMNLATLGWRT